MIPVSGVARNALRTVIGAVGNWGCREFAVFVFGPGSGERIACAPLLMSGHISLYGMLVERARPGGNRVEEWKAVLEQ